MSALLELKNVECRYRGHTILKDLSLHVNRGNIACLLGKSGCGKTTALRAVAGLEPVYHGEIRCDGQVISRPGYTLPPNQRKLGMVFQDYALFPHMTIEDNVAFGIREKSPAEKSSLRDRMLEVVDMARFGKRYPHELSGGQQQRVALARALAAQPLAILLDEPFSNLDVDLREQLSQRVKEILQEHGITGLLVTHHQDEAFALGDHVGVMQDGKILQWDTPFNLYHEPINHFVADFIGQGTFLDATVIAPDQFDTEIGIISGDRAYPWEPGQSAEILLRPDDVIPDSSSKLVAQIEQKAFKGAEIMYTLRLSSGARLLSLFPSHDDYPIGERVGIRLDLQHLVAFPK